MVKSLRSRVAQLCAVALLVVSACSSSPTSSPSPSSSGSAGPGRGSGPVSVLYAGSLVTLMNTQIAPGFNATTGYTFEGDPNGSKALASAIKGETTQGDVFVSAAPAVNASLVGAANGDWVSWYGTFASSPLVLGYNVSSTFAPALKAEPWYQVITSKGFLLGRTDPVADPAGQLAAQAITETATSEKLPALNALAQTTSNVYPEASLVGRLQSGQLDAGFMYSAQAAAAGIPTVTLTALPAPLMATYTVTILNKAPHEAGAEAFVKYLLGPTGIAFMKADALNVVTPPAVTGTGVPAGVASVLAG